MSDAALEYKYKEITHGEFNWQSGDCDGSFFGNRTGEALLLAQSGAKVVVAARRQVEGEETVKQITQAGGEAIFVQTDVTKLSDNERLVAAALETYGRLDIAFNNAGTIGMGPLHEQTEEEWDRQIDVNLKGAFFALKTQIPAFLQNGGGALVFNSSVGAERGISGVAIYSAGKGGVISLARSAAVEYAPQNIRINVVNPGPIVTPMAEAEFGSVDALAEYFVPKLPLGRLGPPEEVAHAVVFLASEEGSFITGQSLNVDGGYTAQ